MIVSKELLEMITTNFKINRFEVSLDTNGFFLYELVIDSRMNGYQFKIAV